MRCGTTTRCVGMRTTHSPHVLYTYRIPYWPCLPCLLSCACRQVGLNDSLGHCDALLEECVPGVPKALNLPLSTQGTLELVLTYTPSGMETSAAALAFAQGKSAFGRRGSAFGTRRLPAPPGVPPLRNPAAASLFAATRQRILMMRVPAVVMLTVAAIAAFLVARGAAAAMVVAAATHPESIIRLAAVTTAAHMVYFRDVK